VVGTASLLLETASTTIVYTSLTKSWRYLDKLLHIFSVGRG
jgi:hypothetical protein